MEFQNPHNERVMIVIVGPPCTGKSEIAKHLGKWVPTSVLYIDDFLCALSLEKGYTVESTPPSYEEAERLYSVAFDSLCHVATLEGRFFKRCVIIKFRLASRFEFDRLIRLSEEAHFARTIIIECRIKNKHRWRNRVSDKERKHWEWYKAGSWEDIDKDKERKYWEWYDLSYGARWLVLDSFDDLNLHTQRHKHVLQELNSSLLDAINFYTVDETYECALYLNDVRRHLLERKLAAVASRDRSKYLCTSRCISDRLDAPCRFPETYPCRSCEEGGKGFSGECNSCLFQTYLKCRLVPTIIDHECHEEHFLSLNFSNDKDVVCKACGTEPFSYAYGCSAYVFYGCYICNRFYDIRCASLPVELKHGHGGYDHVMELEYYYREGMTEESCWCNICYKDMDPEYWFYMCQQCPFYSAHTRCAVPLNEKEERDEKRYYESISLEDVDRKRVV